jgi:hypothetical protein
MMVKSEDALLKLERMEPSKVRQGDQYNTWRGHHGGFNAALDRRKMPWVPAYGSLIVLKYLEGLCSPLFSFEEESLSEDKFCVGVQL